MSFYGLSIIFLLSAFLLTSCRETSPDSQSSIQFSEPVIAKTLEKARQEYVESPNEKKMLEGALTGMLMALDPYSTYLNPESYKIYNQSSKGQFGGLGIEVLLMDGILKVITPLDDMPAQKAGIKAGDIITHVDNIRLAGLAPEDVLKRLHGKPGTTVSLKISRGMATSFTVTTTRELIVLNPVKHRIEGNIGYIRISCFNDQTTDKVIEAIQALQKKLGKNLQGIVLDLRNNPGGPLAQSVSVSKLFLESGIIVEVKGRNQANNKIFKADEKDLLKGIPLAVLINQGSASAAEIVAAALRDNHRAVLIGEKTFGKGSIQALYPLENQKGENFGGIKMTVARFYTPKGEEIQGRGVQPDIFLSLSASEPLKELAKMSLDEDKQLQRAMDLLQGLWAVKMHP